MPCLHIWATKCSCEGGWRLFETVDPAGGPRLGVPVFLGNRVFFLRRTGLKESALGSTACGCWRKLVSYSHPPSGSANCCRLNTNCCDRQLQSMTGQPLLVNGPALLVDWRCVCYILVKFDGKVVFSRQGQSWGVPSLVCALHKASATTRLSVCVCSTTHPLSLFGVDTTRANPCPPASCVLGSAVCGLKLSCGSGVHDLLCGSAPCPCEKQALPQGLQPPSHIRHPHGCRQQNNSHQQVLEMPQWPQGCIEKDDQDLLLT